MIKRKFLKAGGSVAAKAKSRDERTAAFFYLYGELSAQSGLEQIGQYPQHGSTSRLLHSVAVAYYSYQLASFFRLPFHVRDLIRGALLHDYFLYDAQDGDPAHKGHWTRHPEIALENAGREQETKAEIPLHLLQDKTSTYPVRYLRNERDDIQQS